MPGNRPTRRQHFIPRLLLKGFAKRVSQEFVAYEFRHGLSPQRKNIRQIGFANKFYGDTDLEDKLAIRESDYATLLDNLRKGQNNDYNKQLIDELINHLLIRTQNLRRGLEEFGNRTLAMTSKAIVESELGSKFHKNIVEKIKTDPRIQTMVAAVPASKRQEFRRLLEQAAESPQLWQATTHQMKQGLSSVDLGKGARSAQLQALSSEAPYKTRIELMQPFRWAVFRYSPNSFLLGDLGPIGRQDAISEWKHLIAFEGITEVCLPISHDTILVGNAVANPAQLDPASVNLAAAELSRDFFVAHDNSPHESDYRNRLGKRSELVSSDEMESWLREEFGK